MGNLIRFEFRKLYQARVFYIGAIILVGIILLMMGVQKLTELGLEGAGLSFSELDVEYDVDSDPGLLAGFAAYTGSGSGRTWLLSALSNMYVPIAFGVFIAVFFCGDFGNHAIRNVITKGYSRVEIFFAKYLVCLTASIIYALLGFLTGFGFGTLFWKVGTFEAWPVFRLLAVQLVVIAAFNAFFCFFAALLQKTAGALIVAIAGPLALSMILMVIELIFAANGKEVNISAWWIGRFMTAISYIKAPVKDILRSLFGSLGYIAVFTAGGALVSRKREL